MMTIFCLLVLMIADPAVCHMLRGPELIYSGGAGMLLLRCSGHIDTSTADGPSVTGFSR
jgi:hypothetical protein